MVAPRVIGVSPRALFCRSPWRVFLLLAFATKLGTPYALHHQLSPHILRLRSLPRSCTPLLEATEPPPTRTTTQPLETWQAVGALNAATIIWGSQHAVIKDVVEAASPSSVNAARFAIAAMASLPFVPGAPWRPQTEDAAASADEVNAVARTWLAGAELGAWSFLGFALQAVGLQYTTASRSAFLLCRAARLEATQPH